MDLQELNTLIRAPWHSTTHRGVDYAATEADPLPKPVCEVFSGGLGIEGADAAQKLIGRAPDLLAILDRALEQINVVHKAFGAPGDHGYDTRQGQALLALYNFARELRTAMRAAGVTRRRSGSRS